MIERKIEEIKKSLPMGVELVAVSKFQPKESIERAYAVGQRIFGESRPQELAEKYQALPKDIEWHFIGHLQTNKVKTIIPFVSLIHSIDSVRLAEAVSAEALRVGRVVDVLLQVHIACEETKQGFSVDEIVQIIEQKQFNSLCGMRIAGLMGMATYTDNSEQIEREFRKLSELQAKYGFRLLSMGMSEDYLIAIACGSNMVRIGSSIFGSRY